MVGENYLKHRKIFFFGAQKMFRVNPEASRDGVGVLALGKNPGEGTARTQWDQFSGGKGEKAELRNRYNLEKRLLL